MNDRSEINAVLSHLFQMRIQRLSGKKVFIRLERSDSLTVQDKANSLGG